MPTITICSTKSALHFLEKKVRLVKNFIEKLPKSAKVTQECSLTSSICLNWPDLSIGHHSRLIWLKCGAQFSGLIFTGFKLWILGYIRSSWIFTGFLYSLSETVVTSNAIRRLNLANWLGRHNREGLYLNTLFHLKH